MGSFVPSRSLLLAAVLCLSRQALCDTPTGADPADARPGMTEEVVVSATRLPRKTEDIAGTVTVVTAADIERQVAMGLEDLVRYEPGIGMSTAGRGGNEGFVIRGIGGNRVLTLVDGIRSRDVYSAGPSAAYGVDTFDVDDLKSVEIIRGPASTLHGADALGGVVLLTTRQPEDYLGARSAAGTMKNSYVGVRAGGSSANDQGRVGVTAATRLGSGLVSMVRYTYRDFAEREVRGEGEANPLDGHRHDVLAKLQWTPADRHELQATFDLNREDIDYDLRSDLSSSVSASRGRDETDRYRADLRHRWQLEQTLADELETQLFRQRTDGLQHTTQERTSYSFIDPLNPATYAGTGAVRRTDFEFNQDLAGLGVTASKSFDAGRWAHSTVYGVTWERADTERPRNRCDSALADAAVTCAIAAFPFAEPEVFPNRTFPDTETTRTGVYWQDEMVIGTSGLTIVPGVRWDRYEMDPDSDGLAEVGDFGYEVVPVDVNQVSFNFGVLYDVNATVSLFAQYAEGFRPPNFDEANQAFVNYGFRYATVPNPDLEPETSRGVEMGVRTTFSDGYVNLAVYDNRYDDFIDSEFVATSDNGISLYQDRNVGKARIYGAELAGGWQLLPRWELSGSLAYAHGDDETADVPLDTVDPLTAVLALAYTSPGDRWGVDTRVTLVDDKNRVSADDRVSADAYALVDLIGRVRLGDNTRLRFGVFNLTDRQYARWANVQGLEAVDADAIALAQEPGINARVDLSLSF